MNEYYVYGAWEYYEDELKASNAVYIGKGKDDRLDADHSNVPDYDCLIHRKFHGLKDLSEDQALAKEKELIEKFQPKYNSDFK